MGFGEVMQDYMYIYIHGPVVRGWDGGLPRIRGLAEKKSYRLYIYIYSR